MDEVDSRLKAKIGSAAYFLAVGKALGRSLRSASGSTSTTGTGGGP